MLSAIDILKRLVAFDTTSENSNLPLIDWVADYFAGCGVRSVRLPDSSGSKANLVARIGPDRPGGVVLCGHSDVVPVTGQRWTRDPFRLTVEDGKCYGRGTADMKGFLACVLAAVPRLARSKLTLPVTLAMTFDEEVGCLGAPSLAEYLLAENPMPAVVVIGEPTSMGVVRTHKGVRVLRTTISGRGAHSSRTDLGASAIMAAARILGHIGDVAENLATQGVARSEFTPTHTTVNVGKIAGGQAINIVPGTCGFLWEYRCVPGDDADAVLRHVETFVADDVLPRLRRTAPEAAVTTEVLTDLPPLVPDGGERAVEILSALGLAESESAVAFATDGSTLQRAGLPVVVCGPGSMAQGHQPDEYILASELELCERFLGRLGDWAATPARPASARV